MFLIFSYSLYRCWDSSVFSIIKSEPTSSSTINHRSVNHIPSPAPPHDSLLRRHLTDISSARISFSSPKTGLPQLRSACPYNMIGSCPKLVCLHPNRPCIFGDGEDPATPHLRVGRITQSQSPNQKEPNMRPKKPETLQKNEDSY